MSEALEITLMPERLDDAAPEESACFGMLTVTSPAGALTAGIDGFINAPPPGPLVSGYHAAQWLAWNWWRLRYEPRARAAGWWRAHTMAAIGEGYAWPNITIFSDGVRTTFLSAASTRPDTKPFRYLGAPAIVLPSARFEAAVDLFISQMEGRLIEQACTTPTSHVSGRSCGPSGPTRSRPNAAVWKPYWRATLTRQMTTRSTSCWPIPGGSAPRRWAIWRRIRVMAACRSAAPNSTAWRSRKASAVASETSRCCVPEQRCRSEARCRPG